MLKVGEKAPSFSLETNSNETISLNGLKGKKVVLFFYPKDDTPGCTKESCEFRDLSSAFAAKNTVVMGISADDVASHQGFAKKYDLNFPLLADPSHATCEAYGVWGDQEWQGRKYQGISRTTYVIDENGLIKDIHRNVNPVGHAQQILNSL